MSALIQPPSCSAFPEKQMPQAYVVRLAGTCCKCAESGKGSHCRCCDDSGKCDCGGLNGDFVVRQTKDDACCYEHVFADSEFASGSKPCKVEKLRLSIAKHDDGRVSACVVLFFEDSGPVTWHKPRICAPCSIGTLRRIRTNTKCCFPQTIVVNGTPVPDFVAPQPEWYRGDPDDLNDALYWPSLDLDLYEDSPHVPVRYFNGELNLRIKALHSDGQSIPWGHTLIYSNRLSNSYDFGNGYNWLVHELSQLVLQKNDPDFIEKLIKKDPTREGKATGCTLVLLRGTRNALWFDEFLPKNCNEPVWIARFGAKHVLQHDRDRMMFRLVAANGHVWEFDDFTSVCSERARALPPEQRTNRAPGMFKHHIGPGGEEYQKIDATYKDCQIQQVERVTKQDEKQITERFRYEYYKKSKDVSAADAASGAAPVDDENAARLWRVTLERGVKTAGGKLPGLRRATFTYYGQHDKHGNVGDLKTIFTEFHDGKTGWERDTWKHRSDALHYFRYHKHPIDTYCQGLLKLYVAPEGFYRAKQTLDQSIFAVDDKQLKPFAELDVCYGGDDGQSCKCVREPQRRISLPKSFGSALERHVARISVRGNSQTHAFNYTKVRPEPDFGKRFALIEEEREDGSFVSVRTDFIGQCVERELSDARNSLKEWRMYDPLHAGVTYRVAPISDASEERQVEGYLVLAFDYHSRKKMTAYLERVSRGWMATFGAASGTPGSQSAVPKTPLLPLRSYTYAKDPTQYQGQAIETIVSDTTWLVVPSPDSRILRGGLPLAVWSPTTLPRKEFTYDSKRDRRIRYLHKLRPDTAQLEARAVALPAVPSEQHGTDQSALTLQQFDNYGNVVWSVDERRVVSKMEYDQSAGILTKIIHDVTLLSLLRWIGQELIQALRQVFSGIDTSFLSWFHLRGRERITEFVPDRLGRIVKTIGPKFDSLAESPTLLFGSQPGALKQVRPLQFTIVDEAEGEIRSAEGYVDCTASAEHLLSPASVMQYDRAGRITKEKAYASRGFIDKSALQQPGALEHQTELFRLTEHSYANDNTLTHARDYYDIAQEKYRETRFGYDPLGRMNLVVDPTGTARKTSLDVRGLPLEIKLGTSGSVWKTTSKFEYDNGSRQLNSGSLTKRTDFVDDKVSRVARMKYDWLGRVLSVDRDLIVDGGSAAEKFAYGDSQFDDGAATFQFSTEKKASAGTIVDVDIWGRAYRKTTLPVEEPTTKLVEEIWRGQDGAVLKYKPAGVDAVVRYKYDRFGQLETQYFGVSRFPDHWATRPESAHSVDGDIVLEQREFERDALGNVIGIKGYQRKPIYSAHDATPLERMVGDLTRSGIQVPGSRVTYTAVWHDVLSRQRAVADYGTNVPASGRKSVVPAHGGKDALVTKMLYNARGELQRTRDPDFTTGRGETFAEYDDLGRLIEQIENSNSLLKDRRTTKFTYRPDDHIETVTLINGTTGDQTTRYLYGTTLATSDIATGHLRTAVITPDKARTSFAYNRQGEVKEMTDPNGNVHRYEFDGLARLRADQIVRFGRSTDQTVQRIQWDYDKHGRLEEVTSFAAGGKAVNGVRYWHTPLGMVRAESQNHFQRAGDGLNTANEIIDPNVKYEFENTALDEPRVEEMYYPGIILSGGELIRWRNSRRRLGYHYDSAREVNDMLNRVHAIRHAHAESGFLGRIEAEYIYGGVADVNSLSLPEVDLATNLGDYNALDQFSNLRRVGWTQGEQWHELLQHVHDLSRNRVARLNLLSAAPERDEGYGYDALLRLKSFARGKAVVSQQGNSSRVTIPQANQIDQQSWKLDEAGNWKQFKWQESEGQNSPQLSHTRQHSTVNEITGISSTSGGAAQWAKPEYDTAGNMIRVPNPRKPSKLLRCKYDGWNRLVEVRDPSRNVIAAYQYDGLGRRIVKQTKDSEGADRWRHLFYSHDGQVVEERVGSKETELPDLPDRQHFWGVDGQLLFSEHGEMQTHIINRYPFQVTVSALDDRLYAMRDALGSTTALLNDSAELAGRFSYQPYGAPRPLNNDFTVSDESPWHDFDYLVAGYRYDHETGLYHTRARQYHPLLGVWTRRDPAGYTDGLNLYEYVVSSPTNFVDPTGEAIPIVVIIIAGAVVGAAHGVAETYAAANVANREPELWELALGGTLGAVFGAINPVGEFFSAGGAIVGGTIEASTTEDGQFFGTGFQAGGLVGGIAAGFGTAARNAAGVGARYATKRAAITIAPELAGATYGVATGASPTDTLHYTSPVNNPEDEGFG